MNERIVDLESQLAAAREALALKHDLWLDAINHGVAMEQALAEAERVYEDYRVGAHQAAQEIATQRDDALAALRDEHAKVKHQTYEEWVDACLPAAVDRSMWREPVEWCPSCKVIAALTITEAAGEQR